VRPLNLMMTFKLWRALNNPPATHPIFRRTVLLPQLAPRRGLSISGLMIGFVMLMSDFMPTLLILIMPFFLLICGLVYGLECAIRVSQLILTERKNNTFDLLALSPPGALAACWAICTSSLYHKRQFERLRDIVQTSAQLAIAVFLVVAVLVGAMALSIIFSDAQLELPMILPMLNATAVVVLIYVDYVQSTVLGSMVGLVVPTFGSSVIDSFLYAPAVFLLLKFGSYSLWLLIAINLIDTVYQQNGWSGGIGDFGVTIFRVFMMVAIQELIIRGLWRLVLLRTNSQPSEAETALNPN